MFNALDYIREFFPDATERFVEYILWDETGFPSFWNVPIDGASPQDCFKIQVARAAARENFGEFGYLTMDQKIQTIQRAAATNG